MERRAGLRSLKEGEIDFMSDLIITNRADPNVIVALVGNKCDLEDKRVIEREVSELYE